MQVWDSGEEEDVSSAYDSTDDGEHLDDEYNTDAEVPALALTAIACCGFGTMANAVS